MNLKKLTFLIFFMCLSSGFWLSAQRSLWNDEIYTQTYTVERPYGQVWTSQFEEGNNCPLFYLLQKGVCSLVNYKYPGPWHHEWYVKDLRSQIILRINSNVFMSLMIAGIFYFFAKYYSLAAGAYSLLVTLSSFMVWAYWAEARPYAMWASLTAAQLLLFLRLIKAEGEPPRIWQWLAITHLILSFTIATSVVQVAAVSLSLWLFKERNWKRYIGLTIMPSLVSFFYYVRASKYAFSFENTPLQIIGANIPRDRLGFLLVYGLVFMFYVLYQKSQSRKDIRKEAAAFLTLTVLMLLSAVAVLLRFAMAVNPNKLGFAVSNRHVIYLTPVGVIAVTLFAVHLYRTFENKWVRVLLIAMFAGFLFLRVTRTWGQLQGFYV